MQRPDVPCTFVDGKCDSCGAVGYVEVDRGLCPVCFGARLNLEWKCQTTRNCVAKFENLLGVIAIDKPKANGKTSWFPAGAGDTPGSTAPGVHGPAPPERVS